MADVKNGDTGMSGDRKAISFREEAAALIHDVSTPLLTLRALAVQVPDQPEFAELKRRIEDQLDRIGARLDHFWQAIEKTGPKGLRADASDAVTTAATAGLRILLVDDDEIHRDVGCRLLARLGHQVTPCADIAALPHLCADTRFDVVFLDQHGPGMTGSDMARLMTASPDGRPAPRLVGMSSDPRHDHMRALCLDAGMQDYLEKPVTLEKLEAVLGRLVSRPQRPA